MSEETKVTILGEDQITIQVDEPKTDYVKVHYHVLPGCEPSACNHTIAYWKNKSVLDFNIPPTDVFPITTDAGTQTLKLSLGAGAHVFAYSTRSYDPAEYKQFISGFCAVGFVAPYDKAAADEEITCVNLELLEYDLETVTVNVRMPATYKPSTAGNWVGIWEDSFSYGVDPTAFAKVGHDKSEGVTIVNIELKRNQTYTVAYGMGGYSESGIDANARRTVAAILKFRR